MLLINHSPHATHELYLASVTQLYFEHEDERDCRPLWQHLVHV